MVRDETRIITTEMKYMRRTAGYSWTDHKTSTEAGRFWTPRNN
jgi:hypothetical protein